jgi:hypothetical protein
MADQNFETRVGTDARDGGYCLQVCIDGVLHQDRSPAQIRALIEQRRAQQSHNPSARWARLEPIEGLDEDGDVGQLGWAGMVQDGPGWQEG